GRVVDRRHRQLTDILLDQDEAPELASVKVLAVAKGTLVRRLAANVRRPLEWVLTDVDHRGHVRRIFFAGPAPGLLEELELEVVDAKGPKMRATEVKDFVASRWSVALQQGRLVIAIQVVLVATVAKFDTFQQLLGDVRVA